MRTEGGITFLSAGDPHSEHVFLFLPTGEDVATVFWPLFDGWNPPFYAVAPDMPGGLMTDAIACSAQSMSMPAYRILETCSGAFDAEMRWLQGVAAALVGSSGKISFVAHGLGATRAQEYHRRGYSPPLGKLILLSQPTDALYSQMVAPVGGCGPFSPLGGGALPAGLTARSVYATTRATGVTWPVLSPAAIEAPYLAWVGSANFNVSAWEFPFLHQYACQRSRDYMRGDGGGALPPYPPTLILFAKHNDSLIAWRDGQAAAIPPCASADWCTFRQVHIPAQTPAEVRDGQVSMYGHWPHLDSPHGVRGEIEEWLAADDGGDVSGGSVVVPRFGVRPLEEDGMRSDCFETYPLSTVCAAPLPGRGYDTKRFLHRNDCGQKPSVIYTSAYTVAALQTPLGTLTHNTSVAPYWTNGWCAFNMQPICADAILNRDYLFFAKSMRSPRDDTYDFHYCRLNGWLTKQVRTSVHSFDAHTSWATAECAARDAELQRDGEGSLAASTLASAPISLADRHSANESLRSARRRGSATCAYGGGWGHLNGAACDSAYCAYTFGDLGGGDYCVYDDCKGWDPVLGMPLRDNITRA